MWVGRNPRPLVNSITRLVVLSPVALILITFILAAGVRIIPEQGIPANYSP